MKHIVKERRNGASLRSRRLKKLDCTCLKRVCVLFAAGGAALKLFLAADRVWSWQVQASEVRLRQSPTNVVVCCSVTTTRLMCDVRG
jgi:hypothetical protein